MSAPEQILTAYGESQAKYLAKISGDPGRCDRAAILTTAVLQIVKAALLDWLYRGDVDLAAPRAEIEALLRDEIADIERQIAGDRELPE